MTLQTIWIDLKLKVKQNKWAFVVLFLFYLMGVVYYGIQESDKSILNILMVSLSIRDPHLVTDFSGFYQLIWPIFVEVVVFGFLIGALLEKYNPVATSKIVAQNQRNHSVILGYHHLGERIVEFCQKQHKPYAVIELDEDKVTELVNAGEPVVVGDFTEEAVLKDAGIEVCKEVFFVTNDLRQAIVCVDKIRKLNNECKIYLRVFEEECQDYLELPPWNAVAFSSSQWTMETIRKWTDHKQGTTIVLGYNHISQLIVEHLANEHARDVIYIDEQIDEELFDQHPKIKIIQESYSTLKKIEDVVDISTVSQVFICWKSENHFSEALILAMELQKLFPTIEKYVRIFDEETIPIFQKYKALTFSTSARAFHKLRNAVDSHSALYHKK